MPAAGHGRANQHIMEPMRLACVAVGLVGCATHARDPSGGSGTDASNDPNCHWDCFGAIECRGGKATAWAHAPVPCSEWTGQCPHVDVTCAAGCALEFHNDEVVDYE